MRRVFAVSCATGAGIDELRRALFELCPPAPPVEPRAAEAELVDYLVYRPKPERRAFRIFRTESGYRVVGRAPDDEAELEAALRAAGAKPGAEVEVDGETMEFL